MTLTDPATNFVSETQTILNQARHRAATAVNFAMVEAYWLMGKRIVEEQEGAARAQYGDGVIETLSQALVADFGRGFSVANLRNFRQFYLKFQDVGIHYTLCSELSWSHYRLIMRLDDNKARQYYLQECATQKWSVRSLERNITSHYYQRVLSSQSGTQPSAVTDSQNISDFIKDPYVFEFLNLTEATGSHEHTLETALINHLQQFLLELGKGFSFVGRQFRISTETSHFYIDLVFYNYILKCFVLFDLKTNKLKHQDVGQMDMYIRMFDDLQKRADDNPTIGIILCADREETLVKYSVLNGSEQMFASQYKLYLPTEDELKELLRADRFRFSSSHEQDTETE